MPPGKKWPTLRVRTTTSMRALSPRRTVPCTSSSGAVTGATTPGGFTGGLHLGFFADGESGLQFSLRTTC